MAVTRPRKPSDPRLCLAVVACDPISRGGVTDTLSNIGGMLLLGVLATAAEFTTLTRTPDAVIVFCDTVNDWLLAQLGYLRTTANPARAVVVVVNSLDMVGFLAASDAGATSFMLSSECTPAEIIAVTRSAVGGQGRIPPTLLRRN